MQELLSSSTLSAENLSVSAAPRRMQTWWGLNVPSSVRSSAKHPYPSLRGSLTPALTTPTPCTHQQAHMQEGEKRQSSVGGTGWCKPLVLMLSFSGSVVCFLFHPKAEVLPLSQENKRELNERQAQGVGHGCQRVPKGLRYREGTGHNCAASDPASL